jgi:hypothetical protein
MNVIINIFILFLLAPAISPVQPEEVSCHGKESKNKDLPYPDINRTCFLKRF